MITVSLARASDGPPVAVIDPDRFDAVVFDLDGVVTDTAAVHLAAWRRTFDRYLAGLPARTGEHHGPFTDEDYRRYVDGRSRYDGVAGFLASRGVEEGPERIREIGDGKDRLFLERLRRDGVRVFRSTVDLVHQLTAAGLRCAVISASRNCAEVLSAAGLSDLFEVRVDGVVAAELGLPGKPDPAVFVTAAHRLGARPRRTVVVEDAVAGVRAGRDGDFGLVIGVDRTGHGDDLLRAGADLVVTDLGEVRVGRAEDA